MTTIAGRPNEGIPAGPLLAQCAGANVVSSTSTCDRGLLRETNFSAATAPAARTARTSTASSRVRTRRLLARPRFADGLWVRLVDVGRALAQRHYACPVDLVIEVTDELCPQNQGRWRLTAATVSAPSGFSGTCERTTAPADLALPVRVLGGAYLGGTRLGALAAAGLVTEVTPGSVAALSAAMSWDPAPWCPMIF